MEGIFVLLANRIVRGVFCRRTVTIIEPLSEAEQRVMGHGSWVKGREEQGQGARVMGGPKQGTERHVHVKFIIQRNRIN